MDDKEFLELHKNVTAFSRGEQPVFTEAAGVELPRLEDVENYVPEVKENIAQKQQNTPELDMEQVNANAENAVNQYFKSGNEDGVYDDNDLQNVPVGEETNILDTIDQSDTMKAVRRSNAYKRYMYNGEEVIAEARKISKAMNVDEGLILCSPEALDNMRDAYKVFEKEKDIEKVYERFPGLKGLAEKDESAAAIALSNLEDVKVAHGVVNNITNAVSRYWLDYQISKVGDEAFNDGGLTPERQARIKELNSKIQDLKEVPDFFDAPLENAFGTTTEQVAMIARQLAGGSVYGVIGAGAGYFGTKAIGTFFGGGPLGTVATASLARQNAKRGMAIGLRIGGTAEMFKELRGKYYIDALGYKNKAGGQQFTDGEARLLAELQAGLETIIEVGETEYALKVLGKDKFSTSAKSIIQNIIKGAKSNESALALLKTEGAALVKKIGKVGFGEAAEESVQQGGTDLIGNYFATNVAPDGHEEYGLRAYSASEIFGRSIDAGIQALVPSFTMAIGGAGASTVRPIRNFMFNMQVKEAIGEVGLDYKNWTKNTNGVNMLRQLKENFANTKLAKEHPEEAQALLKETLKDSGYEEVVVDTELFKKEEGGSEVLYQLASAVGMSEEEAKTAIDNNENIVVPTDVYAKSVMDNPIADKLLDKISFDKEGDCLERCRKYAASMKHAWDKMIDAESMRKMEAAYNVLKDTIGEDDALDAMGIIELYPEDPAAGARKKVQEQQQEINSLLKPVLDEMNKDIHKGVTEYYRNTETGELHNPEDVNDLFGKEEMKSGGSYERVVVSNNAIWYQNFVKAHGRVPTKTEMIQIAEDVFTGNNEYGVPGWEVNDIETAEAAEANARMLANLKADMAMYERLAEKLKDYDAGKVAAAEGLSESGYAAYKYLVNAIQGGEMNKATQRSAAVGAMLWAHVAERYAEAYQAMGQDVTALDVIKRFKFSNKDRGAGYNQQQAVHIGTELTIQRPVEEVKAAYEELQKLPALEGLFDELDSVDDIVDKRKVARKKFDEIYKNDQGVPVFVDTKYGDKVKVVTATFKEIKRHSANADVLKTIPYIKDLVSTATFLYATKPDPTRTKKMGAFVTEYRTLGNAFKVGSNEYYVKMVLRVEDSGVIVLHDLDLSKKTKVESESSRSDDYESPLELKDSTFVVNSIPWWLEEVKSKLLLNNDNILNQRAWHGTGAVFDNWDLGYAGSGEGGAAHGWGLYFAADRKTAQGYRDMLTGGINYTYKGKPINKLREQIERKGDYAKLEVLDDFLIEEDVNEIAKRDDYDPKAKKWFVEKVAPYISGKGSLFEVEVPENNEMLDEGKTFAEHSKAVQDNVKKLVAGLSEEQKTLFKAPYLDSIRKETASRETLQLDKEKKDYLRMAAWLDKLEEPPTKGLLYRAYLSTLEDLQKDGYDIDALKTSVEARNKAKADFEAKAAEVQAKIDADEARREADYQSRKEAAEKNDIETVLNTMTGVDIYNGLWSVYGNQKDASLTLNKAEVKGIAYDGGRDGRCFVVFSEDAVGTIERYNQAAGRSAETANIPMLEKAMELYNNTGDKNRVYEETGWYMGMDGKWRFEIPDNLDKINVNAFPGKNEVVPLWQIYDNPVLYEAYPWLADVEVYGEELEEYTHGLANGESITLNVNRLFPKGRHEFITTFMGKRYYWAGITVEDENRNVMPGEYNIAFKYINEAKASGESYQSVLDRVDALLEDVDNNLEEAKVKNNIFAINNWEYAKELYGKAKVLIESTYGDFESFDRYMEEDLDKKRIEVGKTLIHEIQHIIQDEENFAMGGNKEQVQQQIDRQMNKTRDAMEKINKHSWDFYVVYEKYVNSYLSGDMDIVNKAKENYDWFKSQYGITDEQEKKILKLGGEYSRLHDQWMSKDSNFDKYQNLHGEQEARLASKKAELNTRMEAMRESYEKGFHGIYEEWAKTAPEELKEKGQRLLQLRKDMNTEDFELTDELYLEYDSLVEIDGLKDLEDALQQHDNDRFRYEGLQQEYQELVTQGIDEFNAIVVFGGNVVAGSALNQQGTQGSIEIKPQGEYIVHLLETADESTFMHEMSHGFYDMMKEMALNENAPDRIKKDYETLRKWAEWNPEQINEYKGTAVYSEFMALDKLIREAAESGSAKTVAADGSERVESYQSLLNRWRQERFARGFEEYLRQGKAPTEGMKGIFSKFKNWLVKIYKGCVGVGAKPTEEVKAVMDRMIASQEEIDLAMKRAEILKWKEAGAEELLTKTSQEYYDNLLAKAREEAEAKVLKLAIKDLDAEEKAKYQAKLDKEREAATERIKQKPVFMIYQYLEQNPGLNVESVAKLLGNMTEAEYKQQLKLEGGSLEKAVDRYMEAYQRELDDESKPGCEQYQAKLREAAEAAVVTSKYTDLIAAYELQTYKKAVQRIRRLEKRLADIEATDEAERKQAEAAIRKEEKARNEQEDRDTRVQDLRRELKSMKESIRAYGKNSQDEITQARYYANNRLDTLPVGEATDFRKWGNLAVRKHQEAMDMLNAGKLEEATKLQKDVLVYRMLEKRAYELNQKYEKKVTRMAARSRTIAREHSMDANDTYLYNHLLYLFGLTEKDAPKPVDFPGVRQQLLMTADGIVDDNVPESSWINPDDWLLNIITGETPMKDGLNSLTMEQFRDVEELMQYVYNAGKDRNSIKTLTDEEGNQITIEELNASIAFEAGKKRDLRDTRENAGKDSRLEKAIRAARQYKVELIKPETILNALGESAMRYLYNPLRQCADKELRMNQELVKKQSAVFAQYRDDVIQAMGKKEGEKFLKDFSSKQQYVLPATTWSKQSKLTHEELVCLALNLGTEIGHKRILDIYELNEGKLRDLLYNLSGADWNLIQNIWDLHEEYWPEVQKVTANVTGVTMEKQEARTFTVMSKDGVSYPIKGGYYHLAYDPEKNIKVNERKADERLKTQSGSNRRFGIGIGMTKERNQYEVKYALKLDLGVMQRALAETVHYISFYETVRDVNRLINTKEFEDTVASYFGKEHYQTLQKWVKDAWALEPESKTALERLNAAMRANQTMSTLGFSMITAAENILNIAPMMAEIGPLNALKAVMGYYGQMMATGLTNPMAMFDQNAFIAEHSIFMAERGESIDPNIHKAQKDNGLNADNIIKKGFKKAEDGAFYFITQTDLMLGRPLWMHEYQRVYNECIAKNMSPDVAERKAVQAGDAAVRHVFGSAADVDKAAVQRSSNELVKFATMFYSYFSTVHNAMVAKGYEYQEQRHKGTNMFKAAAPSLVWGAMMWYLLPAIGSAVMRAYFKGSDDDREPDALAKKIANALASNIVGGLPFVRDIVPAAVDIFTGERMYGFRNVSAYEAAKQALMTVSTIVKAVEGDKDAFDVMRSLARVNVYMSRFPLTLANAMITAVQWFNESDLSDDEMAEYMRAMVMNQKPKK